MNWSRNTSWRQGHVVPADICKALGLTHPTHPDKTLVLVISHDCDLACDLDLEPEIEIIVGRIVDTPSGNSTHAKTARTLHLELGGAQQIWIELLMAQKQHVPKEAFGDALPDQAYKLSPRDFAILQQWLANRYRRSAFPNEFETRLKTAKLHEKIARAVESSANKIVGVFFDLDKGDEIDRTGPDDVYELGILMVYYGAAPDPDSAEAAAKKAAQDIEAKFKAKLYEPDKEWKNIELVRIDVIADSAIRYSEFILLKRWQMDHMSLRFDPQVPIDIG